MTVRAPLALILGLVSFGLGLAGGGQPSAKASPREGLEEISAGGERCELRLKGGRFFLLGYLWASEKRVLEGQGPEHCQAAAQAALQEELECQLPTGSNSGSMTEPATLSCDVQRVLWSYQVPKSPGSRRYEEVARGKVHR
jgi:hypothetical protein